MVLVITANLNFKIEFVHQVPDLCYIQPQFGICKIPGSETFQGSVILPRASCRVLTCIFSIHGRYIGICDPASNSCTAMWLPWAVNTELLSGYAGAALLCATLAQWLSSPGLEIYSEILCWAILPILIRCQKKLENGSILGPAVYEEPHAPPSPPSSQWMFAAGIAAFSLIKMETGATQFLVRIMA